jgi:hypothetical protein
VKAIWWVFDDGQRYCAFTRPVAFDTQAWANSRAESLRFLRIIRIVEETIGESSHG